MLQNRQRLLAFPTFNKAVSVLLDEPKAKCYFAIR